MGFVYILKFESGKYYVGSTNDLERRLKQHSNKHTPTTTRLGSEALVLSQEYPTLQAARAVEYKIKALKRRDYIDRIVLDGCIKILP